MPGLERKRPLGAGDRAEIARLVGIKSYRSIWISDLHLGTRRSRAAALLDFLRRHEAENLFLVGDVIERGKTDAEWFWSVSQQAVSEELRAWSRHGSRVELVPGNHDLDPAFALRMLGLRTSAAELVHRTAEGRIMLVTHGHQFERTLATGRRRPSRTNAPALQLDEWRRTNADARDRPQRSLARWIFGRREPRARGFSAFDERAIYEAVRAHQADGIICGHIHRAEQRPIGPVWYINDGDWVESCTALVEGRNGALRLLRWRRSWVEAEVGMVGRIK